MINFKAIGSRVRDLRKKNGITQEELAEMLSVSSEYVSRIENGASHPSFSLIEKISSILGIDESVMMFGVESDDRLSREIIEKINSLSEEKKKVILNLIDLLY